MRHYVISNRVSGAVFGVYDGADEAAALDTMARDAGYRDHAHACEVAGPSGLAVDRACDGCAESGVAADELGPVESFVGARALCARCYTAVQAPAPKGETYDER